MNEKVEIDREELARLRVDSAELARVREPVIGLEVFEPCMDEDGARMIKTDKHDGYLRFSDAIRVAWQMVENDEKAIPEGFALVPVGVASGVIEYADDLLHQVNKLLNYAGSIADDQEHDDADYTALKNLLAAAPKGDSHE